jgi:hypothetical protein
MALRPVLAIGPANSAGQADAWCRAVQNHLGVTSWSFVRAPLSGGKFPFPTDRTIPAPAFHNPLLSHLRLRRFFRGATHVLLDGYRAVFALPRRGNAGAQARWLAEHGWTAGLVAHGTEIRDVDAHLDRNPHSLYRAADDEWRRTFREIARRNRASARASGVPLFVSTPDLLHELPDAVWLPVCVDERVWRTDGAPFGSGLPTVLHVPSRRLPPIKGTQYIDPVCRELERLRLIRYLAPEHVAHDQMPELVRQADIVVDQLMAASYGVAAVEAMAAGRVVVGHVGAQTRSMMVDEPPIVDATPETLAETLTALVEAPGAALETAARGPGFVSRWHSGAEAADRLRPFLGLGP